jgi:hypothetical protein
MNKVKWFSLVIVLVVALTAIFNYSDKVNLKNESNQKTDSVILNESDLQKSEIKEQQNNTQADTSTEIKKTEVKETAPETAKGDICGTVTILPGASQFEPSPSVGNKVELVGSTGSVVEAKTTDSYGEFKFSDITVGNYKVRELKYKTAESVEVKAGVCTEVKIEVGTP